MNYKCLSQHEWVSGNYRLVSVRPQDIEPIRQWRNAQMNVLRQQTPISRESQQQYYASEIWPSMSLKEPKQVLFSFLDNGNLIAYGGLVHIDWRVRKGEVSVLFDLSERSEILYRQQLSAYLTLLKQAAFDGLELRRIWTEAYDIRPVHISVFEDNGFEFEGRLRHHELVDGQLVDTLFHGCLAADFQCQPISLV